MSKKTAPQFMPKQFKVRMRMYDISLGRKCVKMSLIYMRTKKEIKKIN